MSDELEFARAVRPARPDEAHRLRHEAQEWLRVLALPEDDQQRVVAAIAEAVENAVEHAYADDREGTDEIVGPVGTVELTLWVEPDAVNVSVVDHGHWRRGEPGSEDRSDVVTPEGAAARRGRGIVLMHRSVDSVAIRHTPAGTTVALRHHRDDGATPPPARPRPEEGG